MNHFDYIINEAIKLNKVICVCLHKIDWGKRHIGFVDEYVSMEQLKLIELNDYGLIIRNKTIPFRTIASIEFGGEYNDNLELIYYHNLTSKRNVPRYINVSNTRSFYQRLAKLINNKTICTFFFTNDCFGMGILLGISDGQILINSIGYFGKDDGITSCYLTSLKSIRYNGPLESKTSFNYNR